MAHIKLYLFALLLATATLPSFGFRLTNSSNYRWQLSEPDRLKDVEPQLVLQGEEPTDEPEPLFAAVVYPDGRPTQILVDNLGEPEDFKYQLGDPVSSPYAFIGALGTIQKTARGGTIYFIHCTSSLIDSQSVLTAAHCVTPKKQGTYIFVHGLTDIRVRSFEELQEKKANFAEIESLTHHRQYELSPQIIFDIAVARLATPLDSSNSQAKPICLGSTDTYNTGIVGAGWGLKDCRDASTETLRKAQSTLVEPAECKRIYSRVSRTQISDQHICTFFKTDNGEPAASASGDSGGPLFSLADPNNPVQIGLTSFSIKQARDGPLAKCTQKTIPMVFARVSFFKDFIDGLAPNAQWC